MARSSASRLSAEAIAIAIALWASAAAAEPTPPGGLVNPMVPAIQCLNCHTFPNAAAHAADPPYAPATWQGSLMASSARDPVFWAGVAIADQDVPGGTAACIRCHAPRAFLEGREGAIAMDELLDDDLNGIECELCHRMVDDARLAIPENAQYTIDDVPGPGGEVPKRGPWVYEPGDAPQHGAEAPQARVPPAAVVALLVIHADQRPARRVHHGPGSLSLEHPRKHIPSWLPSCSPPA